MCARLWPQTNSAPMDPTIQDGLSAARKMETNFAHRLVRSETPFSTTLVLDIHIFRNSFPNSTGLNIKAHHQQGYNPGILRMARRRAYASSKVLIPAGLSSCASAIVNPFSDFG